MELMIPDNYEFRPPAKRIVSLVPSLTEWLFDIGLDEEVVGITKFCVHPEKWFRSKTRIGGTKNVQVHKVLQLQPDLVIASKEENIKEQVEEIAAHCTVLLTDIYDFDTALQSMQEIAILCGKEGKGMILCNQITNSFLKFQLSAEPFKVAYCIWKDPWMFAGGDTYISHMLGKASFANLLQHQMRYPTLTLHQLAEARPDIVFLSSEPYPFRDNHVQELEALLPGIPVMLVDGEMFSWYGSRMLHAPSYFAELQAIIGQNRLKMADNS